MNERIKELIKQATNIEYGVDNGFDRVTFDKEKFAELIAADEREACAKLAELAEPYQTADLIRKRGQA